MLLLTFFGILSIVMGKHLTNLTFEQWLALVFDHPVDELKNAWYWDLDRDQWDEDAPETVAFLTQAFENSAEQPPGRLLKWRRNKVCFMKWLRH